jgi:hypothetical protein
MICGVAEVGSHSSRWFEGMRFNGFSGYSTDAEHPTNRNPEIEEWTGTGETP